MFFSYIEIFLYLTGSYFCLTAFLFLGIKSVITLYVPEAVLYMSISASFFSVLKLDFLQITFFFSFYFPLEKDQTFTYN